LHRNCTVSPEKLARCSPEFSRFKSSARVCGSRVIETERGWRRWKEDAEEIIGSYLLAEIESNFIFPFFLISEINFGLKIISGNPEIIVKSRKILRKLRKESGKSLEKVWDVRNPNKIFGDQEKNFRAFQ
jgi:hypothetical protein